jgi:triosephosphate isomerase
LKTYFGHRQAADWFEDVAARVHAHPAITSGQVEFFVLPTYLQIPDALAAFADTAVRIGAQDVSAFAPGPHTGEVSAAELAEIGVTLAEIGHAERRRLFNETERDVAAKATAALAHNITPVLCLGESDRLGADEAAAVSVSQLHADLDGAPAGRVIVAYEPVWAIGGPVAAPAEHITVVGRALRRALGALPDRAGSVVIYGGSAGPGLLTQLGDTLDGLFLGRHAHNVDDLIAVLDEASVLASSKALTALSSPASSARSA